MSRIPRFQEHLKTGFTAEAASAARFRAYAVRADRDGLPNIARHWRALAEDKDRLAVELLEGAGQVHGLEADLANAIAEERYENDALYPRMIRDVDGDAAALLQRVVAAQQEHLSRLESLREASNASEGDVAPPVEVEQGAAA